MTQLREWQNHVLRAVGHREIWCGAPWQPLTWYFQGADHARAAVELNTRMQPCPACWQAILAGGAGGS